ncbi:MAG: hypothetical protein Q7R64_02060 [bacterium]|nr:hypothetical protein [bacterium]
MIEFTTGMLFLLGTFYGDVTSASAEVLPKTPVPQEQALADQPLTLEEYVREYFKDTPIMAEIAKCESRFRHLGKSGKVLRGELTSDDLGVMQINEFYHEDTAKVLGIDLHTLDGNLAYAKWLYQKEGTVPWYSSSKCWQKERTLAQVNSSENSGALAKADIRIAKN